MTGLNPTVIVSKSEPENAVARLQGLGLTAVWADPKTGDYLWYPHGMRYAIERKTISNLLGSLKDRQLVEQTQRGVDEFDKYIILLEGEYRRDPGGRFIYYSPRDPRANRNGWVESGWEYSSVSGMLFDLKLLGADVEHWPVLGDYPTAIARLVTATSSPNHSFIRERQRPTLSVTTVLNGKSYSDSVWALCAFSGIGPEMATALLDQYTSVAGVVTALVKDRRNVYTVTCNGRKIGKSRVDKLYTAITGETCDDAAIVSVV